MPSGRVILITPLFASSVVVITIVLYLALHRFLEDTELIAQADGPDTAARAAVHREAQMQRLVYFAQVMGTAASVETIKRILADTLPGLIGRHDFWISTTPNQWDFVVGPGAAAPAEGGFPKVAGPAGGWTMFPMAVGTDVVGFLAVHPNGAVFEPSEKEVLTQIAGVIAGSIKNAKQFQAARDQSTVDPLTGCVTKQHGFDLFAIEVRRARRAKSALSTIMLDLDYFKDLNDRYGHVGGDRALAAVGELLKRELRASDIRCRFGGEEFLLVLPETSLAAAIRVAETLRQRIAALDVRHGGSPLPVTASFGVAELPVNDHDMLDYVELADAALYQAKRAGRNRVAASNSPGAGVEVSTATTRGPRTRPAPDDVLAGSNDLRP